MFLHNCNHSHSQRFSSYSIADQRKQKSRALGRFATVMKEGGMAEQWNERSKAVSFQHRNPFGKLAKTIFLCEIFLFVLKVLQNKKFRKSSKSLWEKFIKESPFFKLLLWRNEFKKRELILPLKNKLVLTQNSSDTILQRHKLAVTHISSDTKQK